MKTASSHNEHLTGHIELEVSALELIKEKLIMIERGEYQRGRRDERKAIFNELKTIFSARDIFKGHISFEDIGDLIQELKRD